jgi:PKD repeat protein/type 1 glutamine amidotransferase
MVLVAVFALAGAQTASAQAGDQVKVLAFDTTPDAASTAAAAALQALGDADEHFDVVASDDPADFTTENLAQYAAVAYLADDADALTAEQEGALQDFVSSGGGFLGVGGAAQAESANTWFTGLIGARPGASPTAAAPGTVEVGDQVHPATKSLPLLWDRTDIWFNWADSPVGDVHTVAWLRDRSGSTATPHPISWCRDYDGGRSFYTAMGRTAASYDEADFKDHLHGALLWVSGVARANCKATIASNYKGTKLTEPNDPGQLNNTGEPHGLTIAPDGRIIYIGRAAGRPIITDWNNPNVGLGAGTIHVYDPRTGKVTLAAILDVFGNKGNGEERVKNEEGAVGVTVAPDFLQTGHFYVYWMPHSTVNRTTHMGKRRISRFTLDLDTNTLDKSTEKVILEWDTQVDRCCHTGGGMTWDDDGNMYVSVGDNNSSGCDNCAPAPGGYSGNVAPPNFMGVGQQDARRTAGNTNSLNGKILRIKPVADPGATPGVGSTYTIPDGNLFPEADDPGDKTRPEIYVMGVRNPSRLWYDKKNHWLLSAWVGPDAGAPDVNWGPAKYESAVIIAEAGNYGGWPYCMGNKQPYRDRSNTTPSQALGWYDCDHPVNDSPYNTGLHDIPPVRPVNLWYSPQGGCPDYPRDANGVPNYTPAQATYLCPEVHGGGQAIMEGPMYRYEESFGAGAWPQYWDGKWFIGDFQDANNSRHALTVDPANAAQGGLPTHFDDLRSIITPTDFGGSALMDWKFGPDGALYVQHYGGNYFGIGSTSGLWKYEYTGGGPTPMASPSARAIGDFKVRFSSGGSGGTGYTWDFGDGSPVSHEANPVHTYAEAKRYTATLTVSYADGADSTHTVDVDVLAAPDETAPVTTATLNPAAPDPDGNYSRPVTVTLQATDAGGSGLVKTEYRLNGGDWQDYTAPIRRSQPGEYTIDYRSEDGAGNVEDFKTVTFTIVFKENCPSAISDEFDGDALSDDWDVLRPEPDALSVSDGRLHMKIRSGDMIGGTATANNVLLKDAPETSWAASTKFDISDLDDSGQQAGLIVWGSENPNTFVKILFINKGNGTKWFEYVLTEDNQTIDLPNSQPPGGVPDGDVYLRARSNGRGTVIAEWSFDGEKWTQIGGAITGLGDDLRVGLKASDDADSESAAHFDWFRVDCTDLVPPDTTATVDPAKPDGDYGWYTAGPKVTLAADDGLGDGIAKTEYAVDSSDWKTYTGPFTVTGDGQHVVSYRSTDKAPEPNQEEAKTLAVKVDSTAPATTAKLASAGANGPVRVTLSGADAASGVDHTEYRVDGGAWRTTDRSKAILDGTQASFAKWKQAGAGHFVLQGDGSIKPDGGLGMLWYPVQQFGDFSLTLDFKDGRTDGGFSNGGVFTRFPNPDATDLPQCGAGQDPEWVAIYCGQEIQIYDGPTGEPQKTGSIYNFDPLNLQQAKPTQAGEWNRYEVRVVGQKYTIVRNGEVLNEFDNAIPRNSSRAGDPPTQLRQFDEGYVGLQNHSTSDLVEYRNVRVRDLKAPTAETVTVSGRGNHTVEYRSVDTAGNMEGKKSVSFRIGTPAQPSPPPPTGGGEAPEPPTFSLAKLPRTKLARFARRGLKVKVRCDDAMQGSAAITVSRKTRRHLHLRSATLARKTVRCGKAGSKTVSLKPSRKVARALRRSHDSVKATVRVRLRPIGGRVTTHTRRLTLRR